MRNDPTSLGVRPLLVLLTLCLTAACQATAQRVAPPPMLTTQVHGVGSPVGVSPPDTLGTSLPSTQGVLPPDPFQVRTHDAAPVGAVSDPFRPVSPTQAAGGGVDPFRPAATPGVVASPTTVDPFHGGPSAAPAARTPAANPFAPPSPVPSQASSTPPKDPFR